jgi:mitogen-activated protein kinase kinase
MLLQHPWLASLSKPAAISEDDEMTDSSSDAADGDSNPPDNGLTTAGEPIYDREVADWVKSAMERKAAGLMGSSAKPALHAAPLDSVSPAAM